jgi:hypothetical protein
MPMSPIRVLVTDMVALDRDIVERLAGEQPDMTIVSGAADLADVDVLLVSASEPDSLRAYLSLMWTHRRLGVVVVDPADRLGLVRVCRVTVPVRGVDAAWGQYLAEAIRSAADPARTD